MAGTTPVFLNDVRAARLADRTATDLARAAQRLTRQGDHGTAEALLDMARHNRIAALRLRAVRGLVPERSEPEQPWTGAP